MFAAAGLALQPPQGGFPGALRTLVPLAGQRRSSTASLAPINRRRNDMNINKIICTGRLTKDPELRQVSDEMKVCQLRLAVELPGLLGRPCAAWGLGQAGEVYAPG
jgi:hypothetical protein